MPVSTDKIYTNVKAALNVSCWYCDHFQRYDRGDNPEYFDISGECRFTAPFVDTSQALQKDKDYYSERKWGILQAPDQQWCAKFQRSAEQNIPDPIPIGPALSPLGAWDTFTQAPWNKKILPGYVDEPIKGVSCWNCDHFQPLTPRNGPEQTQFVDQGECRFKPPYPFKRGQFDAGDLWEWNRFPYLWKSHCYWCSKWERTPRETGNPPAAGAGAANGSWDCPAAPNGDIEIAALNVIAKTTTKKTK